MNINKKEKSKRVEIIAGLLFGIILVSLFSRYFVIGKIPSASMIPTLQVNDRVIGKVKLKDSDFKKGSIYIFEKENMYMIKRLIAVEGDHVVIQNDKVYINDILIDEPYVKYNTLPDQEFNLDINIPAGKYLFLGDNRCNSRDARYWEEPLVDKEQILAKATRYVYPLTKLGKGVQ